MVEEIKNCSGCSSLPKPKPSSATSARTGVATGRLEDACKDWAQNQVMEEKFMVEGIGKQTYLIPFFEMQTFGNIWVKIIICYVE